MNGADAEKALPDAPSVPEFTVMEVYYLVSAITDPGVPAYLKSTVHGADAEKALPDAPFLPASTVLAVYDSVSAITDSGVSAYLKSISAD